MLIVWHELKLCGEGREGGEGYVSLFGNSGVSEGDCSYLAGVEVWNIECG